MDFIWEMDFNFIFQCEFQYLARVYSGFRYLAGPIWQGSKNQWLWR